MQNKIGGIFIVAFIAGVFTCATAVARAEVFNPSDVIVESLPDLTTNTLGIVPTSNPMLWSGTPIADLSELFRQVGETNLSPAERKLVSHLLSIDISGGTLNDPQGIAGNAEFLKERLQTLFDLGEFDTVSEMISRIPESDVKGDILKIKINTLLLKGETQNACDLLENTADESDTYINKMRISCFLAKEEKNKAVLAYDIYQEKTGDTTSLFATLAENALREIPTDLPPNAVLAPEEIYLASLNKKLPIDFNKQTRAVQITLADLPATDIPLRIMLGERNGLSAEAMMKLYRLPLFESDVANATDEAMQRAVQRAILYQKIMAETEERKKIPLLKEWIDLIKKDNLFVNLAPVIGEVLNSISATPENIDVAFSAVQAYGLTDNAEKAEPWLDELEDNDLPKYRRQRFLLAPLWQNLGGGLPSDMDKLTASYCHENAINACPMIRLFIDPAFYERRLISPAFETVENSSATEKQAPDIMADATYADNETSKTADTVAKETFNGLTREEARTTRLGEALLTAVLDIHAGKRLKQSYVFVQEVARKDMRDSLVREGMIFE